MSGGVKIIRKIVPDDGKDGLIYRDGVRWLRENEIEKRLIDLAPNLERIWMQEILFTDELIAGLLINDGDNQ